MQKTQVLIVGAGPVGLTMALCLAKQGIATIIVEKHPGITNHPKARGINTRTMEIFRQLGVEDAMREHQLPSAAHRFIWLESLQENELTRVSAHVRPSTISPTMTALISQDWVEYELLNKVKEYSNIICNFNHKLISVKQNDKAVEACIKDSLTQNTYSIQADYLVAADGAASTLRQLLDIDMQGQDNLGEFCNIFCEMDLSKYVKDRPSVGYIFTRPDIMGAFLLAKDGQKKWLLGIRIDALESLSRADFDDAFCIDYVRKVIADDSIEVRLINKAFWTMAALVAEKYHDKRIFLAGDAAHRLPPTGGLGMNTGIQDAHNLAWKLALVINGQAKSKLLESYFEERAPIALQNIAWSTKNALRFNRIFTALANKDYETMHAALEEQNEHLNQIGLDIGFRYEQGVLQLNQQDKKPPTNTDSYTPSTYPGCRAPHYILEKNGQEFSTLDLFSKQFVLLSSEHCPDWHQAAQQLSGFPLLSYQIGLNGDLQDKQGQWLDCYQIPVDGAVLVRPDGHVAWRSLGAVNDFKGCLEQILVGLLGHTPNGEESPQ